MALIAGPFEPTCHRAAGSIGGAIDGNVKVGLGVFDHDLRRVCQRDPHMAALVLTAARTVQVRQADPESGHLRAGAAEREVQAALGVRAQGGRE